MNSYQAIKSHIFNTLQRSSDESVDIEGQIKAHREAMAAPELLAKLLNVDKVEDLSSSDWERMQKELETQFNVKMEEGNIITGDEQQKRDNNWWTSAVRPKSDDLYYWNRYKEYMMKYLPPRVVQTIDKDTDIILNNIENPEFVRFDRRGMVVGHVQSGKTGNYAGLICKAADAGYKFIVVIAGGINNLRNQTQERLNESFIGRDGGVYVGVGIGNSQNDKLPVSLTTKEKDFNRQDAEVNGQGISFDNVTTPVILVIKKNTHTLKNVTSWLKKQYRHGVSNHAMLMIDDESDYASINTKEEDDPTTINRRLRELLAIFKRSAYVAYTATPYANIFIDHEAENEMYEEDLFPRDFIYALNAPENYFGAGDIFLDEGQKYLTPVDDYQAILPAKHKKDLAIEKLPESLHDAIHVFLRNIAVRHLRGQNKEHNSMLVHATRFTAVHQKLAGQIRQYLEEIKREVLCYGKLPNAQQQSNLIKQLVNTLARNPVSDFSDDDILQCLSDIIESVVVREVHQGNTVPLEYRKNIVTNAIVVGGTSLSRGYTLEGLSVSYFLRNTVFYDTLMQMGRWFGYREGYQDLCKIYLPDTRIGDFRHIIEATEDLFADFRRMSNENMTPKDFGLAVRRHPDSLLQITARNKQKNVKEFDWVMNLNGRSKESSWLSSDEISRKSNLSAIENLVKKLAIDHKLEEIGKNYLWRNVKNELIIDFFNEFRVYKDDPYGIFSRMPKKFIEEYARKEQENWDIALYGGAGKNENIGGINFNREKRKISVSGDRIEFNKRIVSSGAAEAITLDDRKFIGSDRIKAREKLQRPLLRLHIAETDEYDRLAAFGVTFPKRSISNIQTVKLTINTVKMQNLSLDFEEGEKADD